MRFFPIPMNLNKIIFQLCITIPIPSIGVLIGMYIPEHHYKKIIIFFILKLWLCISPILLMKFDSIKSLFQWVHKKHLWTGFISGIIFFSGIGLAYTFFQNKINPYLIQEIAQRILLTTPHRYILLVCYWIFINSLIEEYFWRGFIFLKLKKILSPLLSSTLVSFFFCLHHFLALNLYFPITLTWIATGGIFFGSLFWCYLCHQSQSIIPGFISHIGADLIIFSIGYRLIFFL